MGSSGETSNKAIDASVGGLVWVRRRNGSWWPGRILGLDEVSESCVVSPRSGTPVKLLGREDASVDWYNLEKSKRVKAFRCGEYDDCIAKAKASAANSNKKAVKYARREDAIIHALEIESSRLAKDEMDASPIDDSLQNENGAESPSESVSHSGDRNEDEAFEIDNDNDDNVEVSDPEKNSNSAQDLSHSGISFEEPNRVRSSSKVQCMQEKRRTPNDSEDEGVKRMRGLEDLGLGVGPKRKVPGSGGGGGGLLELVQKDNASLSDSNNLNSMSNRNGNSSVRGGSSMKRKRTQVVNNNEFLKKKNRRRPLTKVLESSAAMVEAVDCDQLPSGLGGSSNGKVAELEPTESKKVISHENGTSLIDSQPACDTSNIETAKENEIPSTSGSAGNGSSDMLSEVPCVREFAVVDSLCDKPRVCGLKRQGSQNSQSELVINETGSTSSEPTFDVYIGQGTSNKWQLKGKRNSRKTTRIRNQGPIKPADAAEEESKACLDSGKGIEETNGPVVDEGGSKKSLIIKSTSQRLLPYRQSRFTVHSRYRSSDPPSGITSPSDSSLYEVKVEVSANHKSPHVPMVSLMSKLNGKAIVGHPITVEILEDGFFEKATLEAEEEEDGLVDTLVQSKSGSVNNGKVNAKHMVLRPPPRQRSPRKSPRGKKSGLLPKKIRKLSSLNAGKKSDDRKSAAAEKPKGPVIACVPLKLVFSRINEAVNGSARKTNRA